MVPLAKFLARLRGGLPFVFVPILVVAAAVLAASSIPRSAEQQSFNRIEHSQQLLSVWLNRTNALRGFLLTGSISALHASERSVVPYQAALQTEQTDVRHVPAAQAILASEMQSAQRWQRWAAVSVTYIHGHGVRPIPLAISAPRTGAANAFQSASARLTSVMETRRKSAIASAAEIGDAIVVLAFLTLAIAALAYTRKRRTQDKQGMDVERTYVEGRRRLSQVMLAAETAEEACRLAKGAIESQVADSSVEVFRCDNKTEQLELLTPVSEASPLAVSLAGAEPRACLAIRLGAPQTSSPNLPSTVLCELCGHSGYAMCEPLVAGGEVTGSVLVTHPQPLNGSERRTIEDTVAFTTPVLASLRNLQLAQSRAQTDALTDLPNRRALDDMLIRMFAQANRTSKPLSLVLVDIDHFKDANDTFGHDGGDELLSTVASTLAQSVRAADFVARLGGDEFVIALPATDFDGAQILAGKVAAAIAQTRVLRFNWDTTASLGIASYPNHGTSIEAVMRCADDALYQAKNDGRNCVRVASVIPPAASAV